MYNKSLVGTLLIFILISISSCSKDDSLTNYETSQNTSMKLSIIDNHGNNVAGAKVSIYQSHSDWEHRTNQIGKTQVTNSQGNVVFDNLSPIKYFWFIEKGCKNNYNGPVTSQNPISEGHQNIINNIIISSSGTIKLDNYSNNPYNIYINGTFEFALKGNETRYLKNTKLGAYSIKVVQISGYALYPTIKNYNINVKCGQIKAVNFPF